MNQPRKVAKPARGQLNREISVLADASVIRTYYVLLFAFVCIPGIFFNWVHLYSCTVHCCICIYV